MAGPTGPPHGVSRRRASPASTHNSSSQWVLMVTSEVA
eukprot:CAMPEP_0204609826 /NCGR_PEP_ID=MMETSP0661-20131031/61149_1 /ASSEMBLY_ACC=CAM_ASM_000606 /TAXON_ID=109239 /ORGANISM="Alexandrium margalefi, Strain AMGDE01CS-322" /LENGTH=37 /DNA_ID= /DNA_START= /DNA_END= /DNA_ORIENTATION=